MIKVALIGDVHANLPALEAVLDHARRQNAQQIWNIGDFVGYNAFPEEVVQLLSARADVTSIIGNYDLKTLRGEKRLVRLLKRKDPRKVNAFLWAYRQLSDASRDYLRGLPMQRELTVEGWRILLAHGSPASVEEHLMPDTPAERMAELAAMTRAQIVVVGHSHHAFTRQVAETLFINTGSVGRADDGDPRAAYALLTLAPGQRDCQHFRVEYDVERAAQAIIERGQPPEFAEMIRQGRSLNEIDNGEG